MPDTPSLHQRYRVVRRLGTGAFAAVYLADDLRMDRQVAVKIVQHSVDLEDRVLREAQAAAKLSHHHIVTVYEMLREADRTLLFSEYVQGKTLRQLYRERTLSDADIIDLGIQMCRALEHAHKRGVVHRDIKPENIMLADEKPIDVKLMDFGVAQLEDRASITLTGDLVGTLAYMSPEQAEGRNVDSKTDVYSLALTLYEGFVRKDQREGKRLRERLLDASRPEIPSLASVRPDLPKELSDTLRKAMARDRNARPDAARFERMLAEAAEALSAGKQAGTSSARQRTQSGSRGDRAGSRAKSRAPGIHADQGRLVYVAQRILSAAAAFCCLVYVLPRVPFYPSAAIAPLIAVPTFIALLWPFGGGTLTLALMAPPVFAYGVGWGVIYLVPAAVTMGLMRWKHKEWAALLPGVMPLAAMGYIGLALLPLTGALLRRWGALVGLLNGLVLAVAGSLDGWERLPYTFNLSPEATMAAARDAGSPGTVLSEFGGLLSARPELGLQVVAFALLSLPIYAWIGRTPATRFWGMSAYLVLVLAAFVLAPILLLDVPVNMGSFLVAFVPCAIMTFSISLLIPSVRGGSL